MKQVDIKVIGMSCGHCKKSVEDTLKELNGVNSASVSLEDKKATVEYDEAKIDIETIIKAITELEYEASI